MLSESGSGDERIRTSGFSNTDRAYNVLSVCLPEGALYLFELMVEGFVTF